MLVLCFTYIISMSPTHHKDWSSFNTSPSFLLTNITIPFLRPAFIRSSPPSPVVAIFPFNAQSSMKAFPPSYCSLFIFLLPSIQPPFLPPSLPSPFLPLPSCCTAIPLADLRQRYGSSSMAAPSNSLGKRSVINDLAF